MKVGNVLNIRDRRERERQKVIQVYWIIKLIKTNNSARQCITFFSISLSSLHNYETKWPNFNVRLLSISESPINTLCEERGKRKEERGKRKEERGRRKEERGKRKEERGRGSWKSSNCHKLKVIVFWAQRKPNAKLEIYRAFQDRLTFFNRHMIVLISWIFLICQISWEYRTSSHLVF